MKGGLSVGRRLAILRNVRRQLGNETVTVGPKWSVKCRVTNSECRCQATLVLDLMSVSDGKNCPVSDVGNTPFMGPSIVTLTPSCYPALWYLSVKRGKIVCKASQNY